MAARPFHRIAIVNRGDPAMRLIRAVRDIAASTGPAYHTVALFTDPDERALFVREADEAVYLGPAISIDPAGNRRSGYLDLGRLEAALKQANADAAWVGWGFVAQDAGFAELCERLGIVFIGPPPAALRALGDKISAKRLAEAADVPLGRWSGGPVTDAEHALRTATRIGFPLMVKATAGGGGRGVRLVGSARELSQALEAAQAEAELAFGDASVFLEEFVPGARHVEVQVICDAFGQGWALGVRECSIQRRFQKVIEESACRALSPERDAALRAAAVRLCLAAGYCGAATVEFLLDPTTDSLVFMEVNARLQVEHGVTEMVTGADLVRLQLHVAAGGRLDGNPPAARGHAIEARLCAEDPWNGFAASAGRIEVLRLPGGPGIRVDSGVAEGDVMSGDFDSMIAKVIAWGEDRPQALARLARAVEETEVVIGNGVTNRQFLLQVLKHPDLRDGRVDVAWLERTNFTADDGEPEARLALAAAAVEAFEEEAGIERDHFFASAARGRPDAPRTVGKVIDLRYSRIGYRLTVFQHSTSVYQLGVDSARFDVQVERMNQFERRMLAGGRWHRVKVVPQASDFLVEVDGAPFRIDRSDGSILRAPSPAIVSAILVQPGQQVTAGTPVAVLEAMKMLTEIAAPVSGIVTRIFVGPNVQVEASAPLLQIEASPMSDERRGGRISFGDFERAETLSQLDRCLAKLTLLRQIALGYDANDSEMAGFAADHDALCRQLAPNDAIRRVETDVLDIFVDICSLSQGKRRLVDDIGEDAHGQREYLFAYLRFIDGEGRDLPAEFVANLKRALAHYGVYSLNRTRELEASVYAIFKAQRNVEKVLPAIMAILDRLVDIPDADAGAGGRFEMLLERMIAVTQGMFPSLADVAHELRYRRFDQPLFEKARARVYLNMQAHLDYLEVHPGAPDRASRMEELEACPQPLQNLLTGRAQTASDESQRLMLEVLTRRYYRSHELRGFTPFTCAGRVFGEAAYADASGSHRVFSGFGTAGSLAAMATCLKPALEGAVPRGGTADVDFYVWSDEPLDDADAAEPAIRGILNQTGFPLQTRRVLVAASGPGRGLGMSSTQHLTFVRSQDGAFVEDRFYRGLHPMMAERLQVWRLRNFRTERLPSVEDVYLFHGVAFDNSKDERLFAIAEVRDMEPERDEQGRIVQLPVLERMYMEALAAIRREQARRPAGEQLQGNRVTLYIWPSAPFGLEELHPIIERLGAASSGLGMEKTVVRVRLRDRLTGEARPTFLHFSTTPGGGTTVIRFETPTDQPIQPLSAYRQKAVQLARRGLVYPYELVGMLAPAQDGDPNGIPRGEFVEHDLDGDRLVPVKRAPGGNTANLVVGVMSSFTPKFPEGMRRVIVMGDPSRSLGSLAEPECRRIIAALDLAQQMNVPVEWFAVSSGARISMDSGTENMDWIAAVLRRLVEFTQSGGEVNVVVTGINVGAQPYWNAEATMLMHTRGILVMTPASAMVLTGKQALDYSGGVSADDNYGIGGYERVMGPNGQAQYWARDLPSACALLMRHYDLTYRAPGERFPRSISTSDQRDRDVCEFVYPTNLGGDFATVGDVFSADRNPERKNPFDIRTVMAAVIDCDRAPLERWLGMRDAETAVVWDAHLGGHPVCVIGIESRPLTRRGVVPADGPQQWTAGTLFPLSSKKVARAINSASDNRPVVVLANLSGFDGSPESMRSLQLEYGAEIGRAVVNFKGPIVFCVVSRYHGGAFVVFSARLNPQLEIAAVEGSYASVIGGAPAAGVVFSGEVEKRTQSDIRISELEARIVAAEPPEKAVLRSRLAALAPEVRSEKLGEVAAEFDRIHDVQRAQRVGSIHRIIHASTLRPYLIDAVERGMKRELPERAAAGVSGV